MPNMKPEKTPMPEQEAAVRATNFKEVALGYTADEVLGNPRLKRGIEKAVTEICGRD